jgi:homoserine kinase
MSKQLRIYAPATIANVGPGFDLLGLAIDTPGDIIEMEAVDEDAHMIINDTGSPLPEDPLGNVASVAVDALCEHLGESQKFMIRFVEKIPPGSGIGSSAASAAGAVFGANELLGNPLGTKELIPFAMKGEEVASGSAHADNVAPALLGGFTLVHSYQPLEIIEIKAPDRLFCSVVHPDISIATSDSRRILKEMVPMQTAIRQSGKLAGLITGLLRSDYQLIGSSLEDYIAEPERAFLIPGYYRIKQVALDAGALGAGISGSGPSVFALSNDGDLAGTIGREMSSVFSDLKIQCSVFVSAVNRTGVSLMT